MKVPKISAKFELRPGGLIMSKDATNSCDCSQKRERIEETLILTPRNVETVQPLCEQLALNADGRHRIEKRRLETAIEAANYDRLAEAVLRQYQSDLGLFLCRWFRNARLNRLHIVLPCF